MCAFVLYPNIPVVAGKAVVDQASASEMEDMKSDLVDSEATNLSVDTLSKSADVSSWSDLSEVPKKVLVSTGCGTSTTSNQTTTHDVVNENVNSDSTKRESEGVEMIKETKLVSTSTGTSPPPQSISTQVSIFILIQ